MRPAGLAMLLVGACASPSASPEAPARQHDAVTLFADSVALADPTTSFFANMTSGPTPQLGTSLSACPMGGFVAGAGSYPFVSFVGSDYTAPLWSGVNTSTNGLGNDVECLDATTGVAAGPDGVYLPGAAAPLLQNNTWSLTRASAALLAGAFVNDTKGCVFAITDAGAPSLLCGDDSSFGMAVAVNEDKPQLAVGTPGLDKVELFEPRDGGLTRMHTITLPSGLQGGGGFGSVLAYGDVTAAPGKELLVGSGDGVFIFNEAPQLVMSLTLESRVDLNGFEGPPVAIAVEPTALGSWPVRHFWLGFPSKDLVFRCLGTSCDAFAVNLPTAAGSMVGASLAIDRTSLLVGAPNWEHGGAVFAFTAELGAAFADGGFAQECGQSDKPCACGYLCLGGVVCVPSAASVCTADAGLTLDAGVSTKDAGTTSKDAGSADDAGVGGSLGAAELSARGCTSAPVWPLLALALLSLRQKRSR